MEAVIVAIISTCLSPIILVWINRRFKSIETATENTVQQIEKLKRQLSSARRSLRIARSDLKKERINNEEMNKRIMVQEAQMVEIQERESECQELVTLIIERLGLEDDLPKRRS